VGLLLEVKLLNFMILWSENWLFMEMIERVLWAIWSHNLNLWKYWEFKLMFLLFLICMMIRTFWIITIPWSILRINRRNYLLRKVSLTIRFIPGRFRICSRSISLKIRNSVIISEIMPNFKNNLELESRGLYCQVIQVRLLKLELINSKEWAINIEWRSGKITRWKRAVNLRFFQEKITSW